MKSSYHLWKWWGFFGMLLFFEFEKNNGYKKYLFPYCLHQ